VNGECAQRQPELSAWTCIGSCSLCGGKVCVFSGAWNGQPPEPTCHGCGARKKTDKPVIDMVKR